VALDLAGFGLTPRAGRSSAMQANRRLLGRFLHEVPLSGDGRTVLVGNSMGGGLSILQAAIEPSSVDAIVLSSSIVPWARGGWPAPQVVGAFAMYRLPGVGVVAGRIRMTALDPERLVRTGFRMTSARPSSIPPDMVRIHVDMAKTRMNDPDAPAAFVEAARSLLRLGRRPQIARAAMDAVACPVLMMHGAKDRLVPVAYADAAAERETFWRYRRFPDLGHVMQLEAPDRWLAAVEGWLDEQDF
jgi:pimeloyl-ACP methyl ester carboxylesterase